MTIARRYLTLSIFFLIVATTGCHKGSGPADTDAKSDSPTDGPAPVVQTADVTTGVTLQTVEVSGTLTPLPNHEAKINAPFAGIVAQIFVKPNQAVSSGQLVARMSTQQLLGQIRQDKATIAENKIQVQQAQTNSTQQQINTRIAIAQAEAALNGDIATLTNAKQNFARQKQLYKDGLIAGKDVEAAQLAVDTADATVRSQREAVAAARAASFTDVNKRSDIQIAREQVQSAIGALQTAQVQVNLADIKAPLSGIVSSVTANNGEGADTSTNLMTIVDPSEMQLTVSVPTRMLPKIKIGQPVDFHTESVPHMTFTGTVQSIGSQVESSTGTVPVVARIANQSHLLKDDMLATGRIVVDRHTAALLVPKSAVLYDSEGKATIELLGSDNKVAIKDVSIGYSDGDFLEITAGVKLGDRVVTEGNYGLKDGTTVAPSANKKD